MTLLEFAGLDPGNRLILERRHRISVDLLDTANNAELKWNAADDRFFFKYGFVRNRMPGVNAYFAYRLSTLCPTISYDEQIIAQVSKFIRTKANIQYILLFFLFAISGGFLLSFSPLFGEFLKTSYWMLAGLLSMGFLLLCSAYISKSDFLFFSILCFNPVSHAVILFVMNLISGGAFFPETRLDTEFELFMLMVRSYLFPMVFLLTREYVKSIANALEENAAAQTTFMARFRRLGQVNSSNDAPGESSGGALAAPLYSAAAASKASVLHRGYKIDQKLIANCRSLLEEIDRRDDNGEPGTINKNLSRFGLLNVVRDYLLARLASFVETDSSDSAIVAELSSQRSPLRCRHSGLASILAGGVILFVILLAPAILMRDELTEGVTAMYYLAAFLLALYISYRMESSSATNLREQMLNRLSLCSSRTLELKRSSLS